ncbi:MAG: ribosomal protein S12 methylthiotransferase [Sphingobacteriales bacterium]|jgi:ribosomal protein S12 methylthiotransferase
MKTKALHKDKINIITLGCSKNVVDSEVLFSQLKNNNLEVSHESTDKSETVIVNTCGFIDNAKQESIDAILHYAEKRRNGEIKKLVVTGCLSERYKDDLEKEITDVDHYFGTNDLSELLLSVGAEYKHELVGERQTSTPSHYAYLKISEGCDRPCSFCAIPLMRGKHRSKPIEDLVKEAKHLVANGVNEIMLIAQDSTYYGLDIYKKRALADLLRAISDVEGLKWIRLHYAYPSGFPMEVLDVIYERDNICNYLDIPLQHICDDMLKSMRRGITKAKTYELLDVLRSKYPKIAIRTTLIAGYPGESSVHHKEVKEFISRYKFDRLGVFAYSHEENTHAYNLEDNVPDQVKLKRVQNLMELQEEISFDMNQEKVGKEFDVLIDRKEGDYFYGRTEFDSPDVDNEVLIKGTENYLRQGDFVKVKITEATAFDLFGEVV